MDRRTAMSRAQKLLVAGVTVTAAIGCVFGADADAARTGAVDRVVVRGRANLDGAPFDAPYLGAAVKRRARHSLSALAPACAQRAVHMPPGARVEAHIGQTLCAVATTRRIDNFTGFSFDVVGPDAIPGCEIGATITFRVDGRNAHETAVNQAGEGATLNLSLV